VRDSTYVLDGLLYHESDLRIEEHYTDTAGFTDHVFALMHLLGYLERAAHALRGNGHAVDEALLQYLSPLGWEHINLTGDYLWRSSAKIGAGKFRPLRPLQPA